MLQNGQYYQLDLNNLIQAGCFSSDASTSRGYVEFDLKANIPADVSITGAKMYVYVRVFSPSNASVEMRRQSTAFSCNINQSGWNYLDGGVGVGF
jgi:hypothetical protein